MTKKRQLRFVSGPSDSTICEERYVEILIRIMSISSGDDPDEYTSTPVDCEVLKDIIERVKK